MNAALFAILVSFSLTAVIIYLIVKAFKAYKGRTNEENTPTQSTEKIEWHYTPLPSEGEVVEWAAWRSLEHVGMGETRTQACLDYLRQCDNSKDPRKRNDENNRRHIGKSRVP